MIEGRQYTINKYDAVKDWELVSKENRDLVKEFMDYLCATDRSPQTRKVYLHNLQLFFLWVRVERDNKFFADLKKRDFMSWMAYLSGEQKLSPNRVCVLRSTVSSLANFAENILEGEDERFEGYRNVVLKISAPPKSLVREKMFINEEQLRVLIEELEKRELFREALYVIISATTACRKGEIAQLRKSDFDKEKIVDGFYRTHPIRVKSRGTTGKQRQFVIPQEPIQKYLDAYLSTRDDSVEELFVVEGKNGTVPVRPATFNDWCAIFSEILGVPVYPHGFRSSAASMLKDQGKDVMKIQALLGHQSMETTRHYLKPTDEEDVKDLYS